MCHNQKGFIMRINTNVSSLTAQEAAILLNGWGDIGSLFIQNSGHWKVVKFDNIVV